MDMRSGWPFAGSSYYLSPVCSCGVNLPCEHAMWSLWVTLLCRLWGHLAIPCHLLTAESGLLCLEVEAVFWNEAIKLEGHKALHYFSCSSSVWWQLLEKRRKLKKNLPVCVKVCAQDVVFLRTRLQMQAWELFLGTLSPNSAV